jgi:hypothetical protein
LKINEKISPSYEPLKFDLSFDTEKTKQLTTDSKLDNSTSEQLKKNQTPNSTHETLSTTESSNTSPRINSKMFRSESNSDHQKKVSQSKKITINKMLSFQARNTNKEVFNHA